MAREVSHISVMVHPHFLSHYHRENPFNRGRTLALPAPSSKLAQLAGGNEQALQHISETEAMHSFYKKQISRDKKDRKAVFVLVKGLGDPGADYESTATVMPLPIAKAVVDHRRKRQDDLVQYAKNLGNRFILLHPDVEVLDATGDMLARELRKRRFSLGNSEVRVFGEARFACVRDVHRSLRQNAFNAVIDEPRSVG